jgi:antitoxin (DNA-binding transcriptional repressor) of toxin-antitoxin stability system
MYTSMYTMVVKDFSVTQFRKQCLSLMDDLPAEGIVVTKRGKPVARVTPVRVRRMGKRVALPLLKGHGKPGPLRPDTETPYDLVFG